MASEELTASGYIKHHLTNLTFGQHPDGLSRSKKSLTGIRAGDIGMLLRDAFASDSFRYEVNF